MSEQLFFQCWLCDKVFDRVDRLYEHHRVIHWEQSEPLAERLVRLIGDAVRRVRG